MVKQLNDQKVKWSNGQKVKRLNGYKLTYNKPTCPMFVITINSIT